ncbi:MAG TPA: diguanylate cyclase [Casimicrobiaceae bacterium]|jgi:diguanylate cyclase (GGDEF)-like protein
MTSNAADSRLDAVRDPRAALWDLHFHDPARAFEEAQRRVRNETDASSRAWAALTLGFHHLFFTARPEDARQWLDQARAHFDAAGERRGALLCEIGHARLAILRRDVLPAREMLLAIRPEAQTRLRDVDRFWLANALAATYFYNDQMDEAIACLYDAFESLRAAEPSPHLATAMSNLAAALVTVGDFAPARELAQDALALLAQFNNPQIALYTRANLIEAQLGLGETVGALATTETMVADLTPSPRRATQNHYLGIAAEIFAMHGRIEEAQRCAEGAAGILADYPGAFNEVHAAWADATVAQARASDDAPALLAQAARIADERGYLPVVCKAEQRLARLHADGQRWREAYEHTERLLAAEGRRLLHRASARYYLLRVQHELSNARAERDRALAQRRETEELNRRLATLNAELSQKVREIETLQAQLAREAVHDPLTQLFNRRYLDSVTPGLVAAALRRSAPLAVALIDLDQFKRVNDRHGHPAGDRVLREIGALLGSSLRPADVVCRYGGEEFCVVLPDTDATGARTALQALADKLHGMPVTWEGEVLTGFTFSAGLAVLPRNGNGFATLLASADRALYEAKAAGRNRVVEAE